MSENTTIARPYAQAVFEQAVEEGNIAQWSSLLKLLAKIVSDPLMRRLLTDPRVSKAQLQDILTELCGGQLSATGINFIKVLVQASRLKYVAQISALFEKHWADKEGRIDINVITAYELDPEQKTRITAVMAKRLDKQVSISSLVDQSLIGGMIIRAGDSVIDASLRGRLNELRKTLTA